MPEKSLLQGRRRVNRSSDTALRNLSAQRWMSYIISYKRLMQFVCFSFSFGFIIISDCSAGIRVDLPGGHTQVKCRSPWLCLSSHKPIGQLIMIEYTVTPYHTPSLFGPLYSSTYRHRPNYKATTAFISERLKRMCIIARLPIPTHTSLVR